MADQIQSDTAALIQELACSVSIIELGINKAHIAIGENIALNKHMHCSNTMIKRITETNEHNTDRLLITIGKLRHEMEEVKLRQGDESVAGSAVRTLHETVSAKDEEIKRSNQMNAYLIEEVNKLKTTVQYMETVNIELVGTIALLQSTIAGLNQTIQLSGASENPSDAANQLEIDFMLVKQEYDMLMESLHLEILDLEHREGLFQEQRKAFNELSTRREEEIRAQELDLTQHIMTCEKASKQIGEIDMHAHLNEQALELERREIELRKSREELRRGNILLKQQRGELARQADLLKGNENNSSRLLKEIEERENNLKVREQEYEARNAELERQIKHTDSVLSACVELKQRIGEAELRQAEAEEWAKQAELRRAEAEELTKQAELRQAEAEELMSKHKECRFEEQTRILLEREGNLRDREAGVEEQTRLLLEREGNLRDREAEFDRINAELASQRKYVDEIVGASAELKKKQAEVESQAKGLAEARKMLLAYEQSNDERERRNKEAEAKNSKLQKDLEKRRKGFEESVKTREAELAKRHEQLMQDREALIEQEQKNMPSIQMVQVIGNSTTVLTQDSSVQTKEDEAELQIASQALVMELTLNDMMNDRLHAANRVNAELRQQNEKLNAELHKQTSPHYEKVIVECHTRLVQNDECIARLNETVKENEEAIQDLQAEVADAELRLNGKAIAMRAMEKDAREKAEEISFLEKTLEEMKQKEVYLLAKNEEYKKDVDQCQFVMEKVKQEICRQHENMKVAQKQIEAVTRIQENENLREENAKQQDKINVLKGKLIIQEEMVQQLVLMDNIPVGSVVHSPTSPISVIEMEDPIPVLHRLQQETDNLEFDVGNATSCLQILEVRLKARIIKVEEAYDQLVEANKQNLRELREYLIDKQGKEMDAYMKEYNSKLSRLSEQLAESEQNNMMLVREKLEIDMEKSDALNHVRRLEHELKEALASKGQQGKKKKGTDQALELAEKDIQIRRLTEDLERAKKRLTTTDNATKLARVTEELAKATGEVEDAKKFVASITYKYNRAVLDNAEVMAENNKLTEIIKKLKETELQKTRVKTQVVRVHGVDNEGKQVPLSSELVDKELTLKQATKQFNSIFGGKTTDETARSLLAIATNSALSFTKMIEVEKINETIDRLNDNFQARELMDGEESDDDKPVLGRRRMVLDIVPVPASSSCGKASIVELSSDESDDDDFNPFTMGENGCIATTPR